MPPIPRPALIIAGLILLASLAVSIPRQWRTAAVNSRVAAVRAMLDSLRAEIRSCIVELDVRQAAFEEIDRHVDSLRALVDSYESPEGTVEAEDYGAYLEAFDAYNAAIAEWTSRADSLRAGSTACREITDRHNAIADSATAAFREAD